MNTIGTSWIQPNSSVSTDIVCQLILLPNFQPIWWSHYNALGSWYCLCIAYIYKKVFQRCPESSCFNANNYSHCISCQKSWLFLHLRIFAVHIFRSKQAGRHFKKHLLSLLLNFSNLFRLCVTVFALLVKHLKVKLPSYKAGWPPSEVARLLK